MADTLKIRKQFVNNQENGKTKVSPRGRTIIAQGEKYPHL